MVYKPYGRFLDNKRSVQAESVFLNKYKWVIPLWRGRNHVFRVVLFVAIASRHESLREDSRVKRLRQSPQGQRLVVGCVLVGHDLTSTRLSPPECRLVPRRVLFQLRNSSSPAGLIVVCTLVDAASGFPLLPVADESTFSIEVIRCT